MLRKILDIYHNRITHEVDKMDEDSSISYFERVVGLSRLYTQMIDGDVVGYMESWRIDHDQLGHIIADEEFNIHTENITRGPICYIYDFWVDEEYRDTYIPEHLKRQCFLSNQDADVFIWHRRKNVRGSFKPIYVVKSSEAMDKMVKKEFL